MLQNVYIFQCSEVLFGKIELHVKVFLIIMYQVLDICEYLHEKKLKTNRLSLENIYIAAFDYSDPDNINIDVQVPLTPQ